MTSGRSGAGATGRGISPRPTGLVRFVDGLAGLLAAGVLVIGVLLLLAMVIAPAVLDAAGLGPAHGPGVRSVAAHLAVGIGGELAIRFGRRWPTGIRLFADVVIISAAVLVLWFSWWA